LKLASKAFAEVVDATLVAQPGVLQASIEP
jgi:hypothetical protein